MYEYSIMFDCISKESTISSIDRSIFEPFTPSGEKLSQTLQSKRRNTRLQFLILLRDIDFHKCLFSYRDIISYRRNYFPGDLIIEKYEDCHQIPYYIQNPPMPRQLYIMLPKEKIFVPSHLFTECYIKSKIRELIQIFVKLNARKIKYFQYDSQSEINHLGVESASTIPHARLSNVNRVDHEDSKFSGFQHEIELHTNKTPFKIDDFLNTDLYYYLGQETGWQDLIRRRVDYNMTYSRYTYVNNESKLLKGKFVSKLKLLDLAADYDWEKYNEFVIEYEIDYYPSVD